ncbi:transposase, partial [Pseudoflavonifractor sp. 60]|uniref:zinc ribbon domain-containing protein n=1 Tax=Pseudoflavonifractor sp. 60 TaxID=2304576 RepID=UPI00136C3B9B
CVRADDLAELSQNIPFGNVMDSGYGKFREMLRYKLERQGKPLILVDRYFPSSQICSVCGERQEAVSPRGKRWVCPKCGGVQDREVNAARNIKAQGLAQYVQMQKLSKSA